MAEERSFFDKITNVTKSEQKKIENLLDNAFNFKQYADKYGIGEALKKVEEQKAEITRKQAEQKGTDGKAQKKTVPKVLFENEKLDWGDDKITNEVGLGESVGSAMISGLIKIPLGFAYVGAEIKDAFAEEGEKVDEGQVAKLSESIEKSILGVILKETEERARATATGKITEAMIQIYGAAKFAGKPAAKGLAIASKHARKIADKVVNTMSKGSYVSTKSKDLYNTAKKVKDLNKLSKTDKFVGVTIGGGLGTGAVIMKAEDIGTFGDIFFEPGEFTALDRDKKKT